MTLTELIRYAKNSGEDFDDLEIVFRDGRLAAQRAESAGSRMQTLEVEDVIVVDGVMILNNYELDVEEL